MKTLKDMLGEARSVIPEEGPADLMRRLQAGEAVTVVDVRDPDEYREGHIEPATNISRDKDHISEQHGVQVAIDKKSDLYLDGTTIDYYDGLEKRGFTFNNPNVTRSCGCGSSFSV